MEALREKAKVANERIKGLEDGHKDHTSRIAALERSYEVSRHEIPSWIRDAVAEGNSVIHETMAKQDAEIARLKERQQELEVREYKKVHAVWEKIFFAAIGVVVAYVVGAVLSNLFG